MPIVATLTRNFIYEAGKASFDFSSDAFRLILMRDGYVFNSVFHSIYSNVSAIEIDSMGGYSKLAKVLNASSPWAINEDGTSSIYFQPASFISMDPGMEDFSAALIVQYNSGDPNASIIVGCIDFGSTMSIPPSAAFNIKNTGVILGAT